MGSRLVPVNELVTVDDIAERLKMSVNTVSNIVRGKDGKRKLKFPQPIVGRGTRAVWLWPDVEDWHRQTTATAQNKLKRAGSSATTYRQPCWSHGRKGAA